MDDFTRAVWDVLKTQGRCSVSAIAPLIARQPGKDSNRQHSAKVSETLHALMCLGLAVRKDSVRRNGPLTWEAL